MDFDSSSLDLYAGERLWRLRARPETLADLIPGQVRSFDTRPFAGTWWVEPDGRRLSAPALAESGAFVGEIIQRNIPEGEIWLRCLGEQVVIRAHPSELSTLADGTSVLVRWAQVGSHRWLLERRLVGGSGTRTAGRPLPFSI